MTEEKQCAGFNTGSESELRSCVVGGPLSLEKDSSSSGNSIERAGQHRSSVSRSRGAGGYVGSYGNAIDPIKMHAHQNLSVTHFLKPLHVHLNGRVLHLQSEHAKSGYLDAVYHRFSNLLQSWMFGTSLSQRQE